jgi:hypothetical protein
VSLLLGPLNAILCVLQNLALSVLAVIVMAVNALVLSVSGYIDALGLLLPSMPTAPGQLDGGVLQWLGWAGVLQLVGVVVSIVGVLVLLLPVRVALRWVKVL